VLRIMYGGDPPTWGTFAAENDSTVRLQANDTGDSWHITLGQFTGTDPDSGTSYDQVGIAVAGTDSGGDVAATVRGNAGDLDCVLWQRPVDMPLDRSGDPDVIGRFDQLIAEGIQ